jgi:hypothetical protein
MRNNIPPVTRTLTRVLTAARCNHFFRLLLLNLAVAQIFLLVIGGFAQAGSANQAGVVFKLAHP